jgi:hypothetical protein
MWRPKEGVGDKGGGEATRGRGDKGKIIVNDPQYVAPKTLY